MLAAAPTVGGGDIPAAALWWDGFVIAKNISDEDAEASFRAMMHGIRPEVAQEHAEVAAWLIKGYEPTPAAVGVFATAKAGAKPYPMVPYMGLLHTALGNELAEFMQGQEDAEQGARRRDAGLQHRGRGRRLPQLSPPGARGARPRLLPPSRNPLRQTGAPRCRTGPSSPSSLPSLFVMLLFIALPIVSVAYQSLFVEHEQVLIKVENCGPFGCTTETPGRRRGDGRAARASSRWAGSTGSAPTPTPRTSPSTRSRAIWREQPEHRRGARARS